MRIFLSIPLYHTRQYPRHHRWSPKPKVCWWDQKRVSAFPTRGEHLQYWTVTPGTWATLLFCALNLRLTTLRPEAWSLESFSRGSLLHREASAFENSFSNQQQKECVHTQPGNPLGSFTSWGFLKAWNVIIWPARWLAPREGGTWAIPIGAGKGQRAPVQFTLLCPL